MEQYFDNNSQQQNWTIPSGETQESSNSDSTPLFENISPQPKSNEKEFNNSQHLYSVDGCEWIHFQNNHHSNELSPTIFDSGSPTMTTSISTSFPPLSQPTPFDQFLSSPFSSLERNHHHLLVGTSLPSFIRKKLPKEEQEKFAANNKLLMFHHRDYFFAVMDEDNNDLDQLVSNTLKSSSSSSATSSSNARDRRLQASTNKRVRPCSASTTTSDNDDDDDGKQDEEDESIDSECDLFIDEAESTFEDDDDEVCLEEREDNNITTIRNNSSSSLHSVERSTSAKSHSSVVASSSSVSGQTTLPSLHPILVHFFGDKMIGGQRFLTSSILTPCKTKTGAKAIKPNAYVNKRTTIKQTDKTLLLTINNPHGALERTDFEVFIIVDFSSHGENLELRDQLNDKVCPVKKLVLDPVDEYLLSIVEEKQQNNACWDLSCQVSTSNNFGWKSKHKYYKFLVVSNVSGVSSCVSEEFRVSQNVSLFIIILLLSSSKIDPYNRE